MRITIYFAVVVSVTLAAISQGGVAQVAPLGLKVLNVGVPLIVPAAHVPFPQVKRSGQDRAASGQGRCYSRRTGVGIAGNRRNRGVATADVAARSRLIRCRIDRASMPASRRKLFRRDAPTGADCLP